MFHPDIRDEKTINYGHNKALTCWFWLCRNNDNVEAATSKGRYITASKVMYEMMIGR